MRKIPVGLCCGVAVTAAVLVGAPAADADVMLAATLRPTPVAAFSGAVAWSTYDASRRRYRLTIAKDGRIVMPPVPTRSAPFDVSLGPTSTGAIAAVYSRCASDPGHPAKGLLTYMPGFLPNPQTGRGCHVEEYVLGRSRARSLGTGGLRDVSTLWPSIWKDRLVFAGLRKARGRWTTALYDLRLRGHPAARRLAGGPAPPAMVAPRVTGTAVRGDRVAFGWDWLAGNGDGYLSAIFSVVGAQPTKRVAVLHERGGRFVSPGILGRTITAGSAGLGAHGESGGVSFFAPGDPTDLVPTSAYMVGAAVDKSTIYYSVSTATAPGQDCSLLGVAGAPPGCGIYLASASAP